jgi:glycosyltransferase involved in cell wall biosynthesis
MSLNSRGYHLMGGAARRDAQRVRILVDYRPALRARTGVGEYMHELVRAYAAAHDDEIAVFTSSWKDRPAAATGSQLGARVIDRRVPVRVLNFLWHRLEWPPVEMLAGNVDIVHAAHPLLIPSRHAARVVTVHDLFFLSTPAQTRAEVRRDYVPLAARHARRADAVITPSHYTGSLVVERCGVAPDRVHVCPFGAPRWRTLGHVPNLPADGYLLFVGTLERRKNVGTLLDAYTRLLRAVPDAPRLVLAGGATSDAAAWLARLAAEPLKGHVEHIGYFAQERREALYAGARALLLPSLDEGFGIPALEAMSAGVPVIASNRGALPEVVGEGGTLLDATDVEQWAAAMERLVRDDDWAAAQGQAGLARARAFNWASTAVLLRQAYVDAMARRRSAP